MANNVADMKEWNIRERFSEIMGLIPSAFSFKKSDDELLPLVAALLYLRQEESLYLRQGKNLDSFEDYVICRIKDEDIDICLCCGKEYIDDDIDSDDDIKRELYSAFMIADDASEPGYIIQFADSLIHTVFFEGELLAILDKAISEVKGSKAGIVQQPRELSVLVDRILKVETHTIFDPFGGLMDFATTSTDRNFTANEISKQVITLAYFRLALAGVLDHTVLHNHNSEMWNVSGVDAIVTVPPFGLYMSMKDSLFGRSQAAEDVALWRFEQSTNESGELVTIVPASFLSGDSKSDLRRSITEKNWLDFVCLLPSNIFQSTGVQTALVRLSKVRTYKAPVLLVDASNCYYKKGAKNVLDVDSVLKLFKEGSDAVMVSPMEILEQDASWNVQWFVQRKQEVFTEGYHVVKLADILSVARGSDMDGETQGHLVSVSWLASDSFLFEKQPNEFPVSGELSSTKRITQPVVLVSLVREPRPTYCEASEETPIYVKSDVCAFSIVNESVHPGYLCVELAKRLKPTAGTLMPRLTRAEILSTMVEFPSLNTQRSIIEQNNVFEGMRKEWHLSKLGELKMQKTIDELIADSKKQFRARKHSLMQNSVSLATNWEDLKDYLSTNDGRFDENDTIGVLNPVRIGEIINAISENIKIMENKIYHLTDEDIEWGETEEIVMQDFIVDYIAGHQTARYRFEFEPKENVNMEGYDQNGLVIYIEKPDWKVLMPRKALQQVFDNIVSNARDHGFVDGNTNYVIKFDYFYTLSPRSIVLEISNNGRALAEGVDTEFITTYGSSTKLNDKNRDGESVHEGQGGSEIEGILKQYNAKVEVVSDPDAVFAVTYRIVFNDVKDTIVGTEVPDF